MGFYNKCNNKISKFDEAKTEDGHKFVNSTVPMVKNLRVRKLEGIK